MITRQKELIQLWEALQQLLLIIIPSAGSKEEPTTSPGIPVMLSAITRVGCHAYAPIRVHY